MGDFWPGRSRLTRSDLSILVVLRVLPWGERGSALFFFTMFPRSSPQHAITSRCHSSNKLGGAVQKKPLRLNGHNVVRDTTQRPITYLLPNSFSPTTGPPSPDLSVDSVRFVDLNPIAVGDGDVSFWPTPNPCLNKVILCSRSFNVTRRSLLASRFSLRFAHRTSSTPTPAQMTTRTR